MKLSYTLLIYCLLLFHFSLQGQSNQHLDSLELLLEERVSDTSKVNLLNFLAERYVDKDVLKSQRFANVALSLSTRLEYKEGLATANTILGAAYKSQKRYTGALQYYVRNLGIYQNLNDKFGLAATYNYIGDIYIFKKEYSVAKINFLRGLELNKKNGNAKTLAGSYNNLARVSYLENDYQQALLYYNEALKVNSGDNNEKIITYKGIGETYLGKGNYREAKRYFILGIKVAEKKDNYLELEQLYLFVSDIFAQQGNHKMAYEYFKSHIEKKDYLLKSFTDKQFEKITGELENQRKEHEIQILHHENVLRDKELSKASYQRKIGISGTVVLVIIVIILFRNNKKKKEYNNILINQKEEIMAQRDNIQSQKEEIELQWFNINKQNKDIERSYQSIQILNQLGHYINSSLELETIIKTVYQGINQIMFSESFGVGVLNTEKDKLVFKNFLEKGTEVPLVSISMDDDSRLAVWCINNKKEVFINDYEAQIFDYLENDAGAIVGDVPESVIYIPLFHNQESIGVVTAQNFRKNAFTKHHLDMFKGLATYLATAIDKSIAYSQIEKQSSELAEQNKDITDSINYAKRIQTALLPKLKLIKEHLPETFILFKPKDIVSGDFYWFDTYNDKVFIAAVDCTGHGVPGAFMSMIGLEQLTEIVNVNGITTPSEILDELHNSVIRILRQDESEYDKINVKDGMDMAICVIDKKNNTLDFAGAMNPLIYIEDGELKQIKGDKFPVGGSISKGDKEFTNHKLVLDKIEAFYIYSDGYQDQFGGEKGKKFMSKKFKELLHNIHLKPTEQQFEILETKLDDWMNNGIEIQDQVDDVLVIGYRNT